MFSSLPQRLIWVSRVSSYKMFLALQLPEYLRFMKIIPILIFFILISIIFILEQYSKTIEKINSETYKFENSLSASNISINVFSHYIKNELLGITSELNFIKENPSSKNDDIDKVIDTCNNIYQHLNVLQQNSKKIILTQHLFDIVSLLKNFISKYDGLFKENKIEVQVYLPDYKIYIFGDEFYINQVFRNITINSIEALQKCNNSIKTISYKIIKIDDKIFINIADNGPGINPNLINKVFDPFISTKATRNNWGIGLSFVKRIVVTHYGTINLQNTNPGLQTIITLPTVDKSNLVNSTKRSIKYE